MDGDGFAEPTGWVMGDDGLLALDANLNGTIDDISELFGSPLVSGFTELATHDANLDGVIDAADAVFADLRVWQDADRDAVTDPGELKTLTELGIESISLTTQAPGAGEIAGNGIDDDGNGRVDDVNGWDFVSNDASVFDGQSDDHGTHVAGTIGGVGGNGQGVAGVCWTVKMVSGKFLGAGGGTTANAILAVDYMTDLKTRHNLKMVATSNSWGGGGFSQGLKDAIERGGAAGILFIAAAGNSAVNSDTNPQYPAAYDSDAIISVASITSTGALSGFSNYGATSVDIGAPGSDVWSTLPGRFKFQSKYGSYSGTSMATPHVSGAAALYLSVNPGASAAQVKAPILNAATPTPSLAGKTVTGGRLNVSGF